MPMVKLWLVVGGGDKVMADRRWRRQNYTWSWVVVGVGGKIIAGSGWLHNSVMPLFSKTCRTSFLNNVVIT